MKEISESLFIISKIEKRFKLMNVIIYANAGFGESANIVSLSNYSDLKAL